ncbi:MAG: hypothetical protein JXR03_20400 [Cyclobacteriaceae bacterium]
MTIIFVAIEIIVLITILSSSDKNESGNRFWQLKKLWNALFTLFGQLLAFLIWIIGWLLLFGWTVAGIWLLFSGNLPSTLNFDIIIIPGIFGKLAFIGIFVFITWKLWKMAIDSDSFLRANPFEVFKKEE